MSQNTNDLIKNIKVPGQNQNSKLMAPDAKDMPLSDEDDTQREWRKLESSCEGPNQ